MERTNTTSLASLHSPSTRNHFDDFLDNVRETTTRSRAPAPDVQQPRSDGDEPESKEDRNRRTDSHTFDEGVHTDRLVQVNNRHRSPNQQQTTGDNKHNGQDSLQTAPSPTQPVNHFTRSIKNRTTDTITPTILKTIMYHTFT